MIDFSTIGYKFTEKQMNALHHYITNGNKVEAYRYAYNTENMNEKSTYNRAKELWRKWYMKEACELIQKEAMNKLSERANDIADHAAWVLEKAMLLASFNIRKFIKIDDFGNAVYDFSTATDDDWYCISEYTVDEIAKGSKDDKFFVDRVKLKSHDKIKALGLVGKHVKVQAFKEVTENINKTDMRITSTNAVDAANEYEKIMR